MRPRFRICRSLSFVLTVAAFVACGEDPSGPELRNVLAGKGGAASPGGPTVNGTDPESAPQDTTLDVRVFGSGYDNGSKVTFLLDGQATPKVKTNSTRFISSSELVANITIAADAIPDRYDVQVTTQRGKKGVGIELFTITLSRAGQLALEIAFRDDAADGLASDGMTGLAYCDPGVPCYEEQQDFVGAHLSGNGNLMFTVEVPRGETQVRRVRVLGQLHVTRRIFTNDNQDSEGVTVPDLLDMPDGTITSRLIIDRTDGNGQYRYGVMCIGNAFDRDDANAIPAERISVTRSGNTWVLEGWGARHCETSGKGKNTTITETTVWMPFRMTLVGIPWPD